MPETSLGTGLVMALQLYSRLPTGTLPQRAPDLSHIAPALPFASVLIGLLPVLVLVLGVFIGLPTSYAALLAVGAAALVTGAMAEDALGDSADGLAGGRSRERRLEIFRDSRLGTYGVIAVVLLTGLRVAGLTALSGRSIWIAALLWLAAGVLSRSGALWLTQALPPARQDGAAAAAGQVSAQAFALGAVFAVLIAFILSAPFVGWLGLVVTLVALAAAIFGWVRLCARLVGGQTGDLIGGLQALLEIVALTTFIVFAGQ